MFSPHSMDQKRARKGQAQPHAWHAGDVSASPEQGEACELAAVTRRRKPEWQAFKFSEKVWGISDSLSATGWSASIITTR